MQFWKIREKVMDKPISRTLLAIDVVGAVTGIALFVWAVVMMLG